MAMWHRTRKADLGLRALGSGLCALACLAVAWLVALQATPQASGVLAYGLACAGFLCGSSGGALTTYGAHLFDRIEVSTRWQPRADQVSSTGMLREDGR